MKIDPRRSFGNRECPACACEVAANVNRCPICGYEFPHHAGLAKHARSWGVWVLLALLAVLILGLL